MIRIGKIVATHGLGGNLVLTHVMGGAQWLKKDHVLHVEMQKGSYIPYFLTMVKATAPGEYHIAVEGVATVEAARKMVTKHVYVDEAVLSAYARQSPLLWIDFEAIDKKHGSLGLVKDVVQTGKQWLATLTIKETEVLVPLIEQTILNVDVKARMIELELPDGLLEIYLGEGA